MFCYYWRNLFFIPHCYHCLCIKPNWGFSTCILLSISSFSLFPIFLVLWVDSASSWAPISACALSSTGDRLRASPGLWDRCQPGHSFAHTLQCLPVRRARGARAHTECRRGVLVWDHPLLLAEAPATLEALPALLSAAKSTDQTSLLWENKHHQPKAHHANVLHKAECDTFTSKYNLF